MRTFRLPLLFLLILAPLHTAMADPAATWDFGVETAGQDVVWTSPTAVNPDADLYVMSYQIENVTATVRYLFLTFDLDVTDQIPPEQLGGQEVLDGPPPLVLFDGQMVYPDPPEPPGLSGTTQLVLGSDGFGRMSLTDVTLGNVTTNVPGLGVVTVQVLGISVSGQWTVQPIDRGDANCDGDMDVDDAPPFVQAVLAPDEYEAAQTGCSLSTCDIDNDGFIDGRDVAAFVDLLLSSP